MHRGGQRKALRFFRIAHLGDRDGAVSRGAGRGPRRAGRRFGGRAGAGACCFALFGGVDRLGTRQRTLFLAHCGALGALGRRGGRSFSAAGLDCPLRGLSTTPVLAVAATQGEHQGDRDRDERSRSREIAQTRQPSLGARLQSSPV